MAHTLSNIENRKVILGLSGGVDSAVAAVLLKGAGAQVEALHMTNWEDDDGYCNAAAELQDARHVCEQLDIPLHHVNFAKEYRDRVFESFLAEYRAGRTPNPDVLCNREIKFGVFREYAKRLGGDVLATGHYAQITEYDGEIALLKGADRGKDQSYFLHSVSAEALRETIFPLGQMQKTRVRQLAHDHGLSISDKKDSTGICFIGERPFREFLSHHITADPGPIRSTNGRKLGTHDGLMFYTLGQRQGLGIGGRKDTSDEPWYVVDKTTDDNALIVAQGESDLLYSRNLVAVNTHWIRATPTELCEGLTLSAKIRYRQADQDCHVRTNDDHSLRVDFIEPQRAIAPGQYVVFYADDRCLGGAVIDSVLPGQCAQSPMRTAAKS